MTGEIKLWQFDVDAATAAVLFIIKGCKELGYTPDRHIGSLNFSTLPRNHISRNTVV